MIIVNARFTSFKSIRNAIVISPKKYLKLLNNLEYLTKKAPGYQKNGKLRFLPQGLHKE